MRQTRRSSARSAIQERIIRCGHLHFGQTQTPLNSSRVDLLCDDSEAPKVAVDFARLHASEERLLNADSSGAGALPAGP